MESNHLDNAIRPSVSGKDLDCDKRIPMVAHLRAVPAIGLRLRISASKDSSRRFGLQIGNRTHIRD